MVRNGDFVRFQVSCILGMEVAWYEQHVVSFARDGITEIKGVQLGFMYWPW